MKIIIVVIIKCFWKNVHTNNTKMSFMIELKVLKVLILIKQMPQKGVLFAAISIF